jgi:hypothetical protein
MVEAWPSPSKYNRVSRCTFQRTRVEPAAYSKQSKRGLWLKALPHVERAVTPRTLSKPTNSLPNCSSTVFFNNDGRNVSNRVGWMDVVWGRAVVNDDGEEEAGTGGVGAEVNEGGLRSSSLFVSSLFSWRGRVSGGTVCGTVCIFFYCLIMFCIIIQKHETFRGRSCRGFDLNSIYLRIFRSGVRRTFPATALPPPAPPPPPPPLN